MNQDRLIESFYPDGSLVTAGPGRRLAGALLDGIVLSFTFFVGWLIWFIIVAPNGQTPGKQMVGMYVMRADGTRAGGGVTWVREVIIKWLVVTLVSWATFGIFPLIAAIWCLWDRNVQCLWDKMASTYVAWSPRGYKPLTDQELRQTGQSLQVLQPEPRAQSYQPDAVLRPPEDSPFAQPAGSPFAGGTRFESPETTTPPPATEPPGAAPPEAQEVTSPFATGPAAPPPPAQSPASDVFAALPGDMQPQYEVSPFALSSGASSGPDADAPVPPGLPPSPFAEPPAMPAPGQAPGSFDAEPSPFDFSDDPTFVPDSSFGPGGEPEPGSQFEPPAVPAPESLPTVADRLRELSRLRAEDLLTEAEYQERRQALLDHL